MTQEQLSQLKQYKNDADAAYHQLDNVKVDYDDFAQVAAASSLKATESKLIYDGLYNKFIGYPTFLKNLYNIYLDAKAQSDEDQVTLNQKLDEVKKYQSDYDNVINKISEFQTQIDVEDLGNELQDIANNPDNLRFSYELVAAKDSADYAKKVADDLAAQAAAQASIGRINGVETCISKITGKDIGMDKCRTSSSPSSSIGGGSSTTKAPTPQEIASKKVDDWIKIANNAINPAPAPITTPSPTPAPTPESVPANAPTAASSVMPITASAQNLYNNLPDTPSQTTSTIQNTSNSSINSFVFNVDLIKLTDDLNKAKSSGPPSARQQNIIYTLCSVKNGRIVTPESKLTDGMLWAQYVYQFSVTSDEIAIARAYCPSSEVSNNFYNKEVINSYDSYSYNANYYSINIFSENEPINFKKQDQVDVIDLTPLSTYYMYGVISNIFKDPNYGWNIVVTIYGNAGNPPSLQNNTSSSSQKWQLIKDTTNVDLSKLGIDQQALNYYNSIKSPSIPSNINYKGNWNQYQYYYVNDLVNFGDYAYLITRDIPNSLYYYHPDQSQLNSYVKIIGDISNPETGWRQQYINNVYCNIKNGILHDSKYAYNESNSNGISWETFKRNRGVNSQEEAIARAICKDSELSSSYYKKGFDGSIITSKNNVNLNNGLILLAGVSAIFLVHNILKNK